MCIDRHELVKAKKKLLSQLLKIPDDEKTTSDIELEAELMNDWEIEGFFLSDREKKKLAEIDKAARGEEDGHNSIRLLERASKFTPVSGDHIQRPSMPGGIVEDDKQ